MRFKQHIVETLDDNKDMPQENYDLLRKKCMPFLKDVKKRINKTNHFLFRGLTGSGGRSFFEKVVRRDRRPLDSGQEWHADLGAGFKRKFGIDARAKGLFASILPSNQFGYPFIIIPQGKYYCLWSDTITDATEWIPDGIYGFGGDHMQSMIDKHVDKLMTTYKKGDVNKCIQAIDSSPSLRTEVTVITTFYYAIGQRHEPYLEQWIKNEI